MLIRKNISGFTIIELIMVMLVLGMLMGFGASKFPGAQRSSRDGRRVSDLKQYQAALESFANKSKGLYPSRNSPQNVSVLCSDLGLSRCPSDPHAGRSDCDGTCNYFYSSNGSCNNGSACASKYVLYARLERETDIWANCSNGSSALVDSASDFSNGNCPMAIPTPTPTSVPI